MKLLSLELVKVKKRMLQFVGWKRPKPDAQRLQFYALGEKTEPLVLTLTPAVPRYWVPTYSVAAIGEPFPEVACIEVSPCRLLPPPCHQSKKEFESQSHGYGVFEPWKAAYIQTHGQVSLLEPSDDVPLQERLDRIQSAIRPAHEQEKTSWLQKIQRTTDATLQELGIATENERAKQIAELRQQLGILESDSPMEGVPTAGWLKLTLPDVKRGVAGIRDQWLHEKWAKESGEDLNAMAQERRVFRHWLIIHTGTPANVFDATTRQWRQGVTPPSLGENFEGNPQFMEACAKVRYRARFADNASTVVYLAECESPREELDAVELDELAKLRGAPSNNDLARIEKAAAKIASAVPRLEAVPAQLTAKTEALANVISPLNNLYSQVELAEIRKRALGKGVPDLIADWVMFRFQASDPPRLPTKGDAFASCGPGTVIGKKLADAGVGISKQRLADHLTVMRRLLEEKGWIARSGPGKARKRESNFQPDDRREDLNLPSPRESAEDRDDERQKAAELAAEGEEDEESDGNSSP